jgi:hypothetical protein
MVLKCFKRVVLRIMTNDADAELQLSCKFGANMDASFELIDLAMRLNLNLVGIRRVPFLLKSKYNEPHTF